MAGRFGRDRERITELERRVAYCDETHMAFDETLRTFREETHVMATSGGADEFERTFGALEQQHREGMLRDMYKGLPPVEKLGLIATVTGNTALEGFLTDIANEESAYNLAMLKIETEATARYVLRPEDIPADAEVRIGLCFNSDIRARDEGQSSADITPARTLTLRSLGEGSFKIINELVAPGFDFDKKEHFDINDIVQIGTAYVDGSKKKKKREDVCRLEEMLAVTCSGKTSFISLRRHSGKPSKRPLPPLVVSRIDIDQRLILPPGPNPAPTPGQVNADSGSPH